ncbi:MAG: MMPL family transporter [Acidimicrobiales bacterium]
MIGRLSSFALRRPRLVLTLAVLLLPVLAVAAAGTEQTLSVGGFTAPNAESTAVARELEDRFATAAPNYVLVATTDRGFVTDADHAAAGVALVASLRQEPGVADVVAPWTFGALPPGIANPLVAERGGTAAVAVRLAGDEDTQRAAADRLARYAGPWGPFTLTATGPAEISREAAEAVRGDLVRGELFAAPLTLIGLLLLFRGWRAALLPLLVAALTVLATFAGLHLVGRFTTLSVFSLNFSSLLGLGLSVDYCLLMVARFREEREAGAEVRPAAARAARTAGPTVVASAATVALCLAALLAFPVPYLRSFAVAGVLVVTTAALGTLTVVPAALAAAGHRIAPAPSVPAAAPIGPQGGGPGFWGRQAARVMARAGWWAVLVTAVLVAAGLPFLRFDASRIDDRALPAGAGARTGADELRASLDPAELSPLTVLVPGLAPTDTAAVEAFSRDLLAVDGVRRVDSAAGFTTPAGTIAPTRYNERFHPEAGNGTWFSVVNAHNPETAAAEDVVRAIRARHPEARVGGTTASVLDAVDTVADGLPLAGAMIAATTLVLLFALTGGVLLAVKGLILNLLSLTCTFGVLVLVFQDGHLGSLLGVTATGRIDVFTPVLVFCIAFGLSMDYQVFLLARITESHARTGDTPASVVEGLARTGRTVTAAAGLLAVAVTALTVSQVATAKMLGVGLTVAVLVDAFAVRATLVPALMRLAGRANWWAPAPLAAARRRLPSLQH